MWSRWRHGGGRGGDHGIKAGTEEEWARVGRRKGADIEGTDIEVAVGRRSQAR
jgi:hypothetical protein